MRDFLNSDETRRRFYTSNKAQEVAKGKLQVNELAGNLEAVATRIYAIRNRIVHTKGDGESDEKPLFPFDPEVALLKHDIDLVSFLTQRALVYSSGPLRL